METLTAFAIASSYILHTLGARLTYLLISFFGNASRRCLFPGSPKSTEGTLPSCTSKLFFEDSTVDHRSQISLGYLSFRSSRQGQSGTFLVFSELMVPDLCLGKAWIVSGSTSPRCASYFELDQKHGQDRKNRKRGVSLLDAASNNWP